VLLILLRQVRRMKHLLIVAAALIVLASEAHAQSFAAVASWYGGGERLSRHTASGEVFRPNGLTAAHRHLRFGTLLRVSYAGRAVVVRVNDRGPFAAGRSLDLSRGAARALQMRATSRVVCEVVDVGGSYRASW
jgi:rare lipoprotein A